MRSVRFFLVAAACAALGLAAVAGLATRDAAAAGQTIGVLKTGNRTNAHRSARGVDQVVVHVTEGSFWGSVRWLRNPRSRGSSHFVVSREGRIVQMVDLADVAWHAGNNRTNWRSVGIEHEGHTRHGGFTGEQYRASARLLAYLSRRLGIRLDRRHVIGHNEVPNPYGRGRGGVDHHADPGRRWRWRHYLALARQYARSPQQPEFVRLAPPAPAPRADPRPVVRERVIVCGSGRSVHFTTLEDRQTVSSIVQWRAKTCGRRMWRVDFLVDGKVAGRDRVWPFMLAGSRGLNTTDLVNGWHTLSLRAHGPRRYRVLRSIRVRVVNPPFAVAPVGLGSGQAVSGQVRFRAATNAPAKQIELLRDGEVVARAAAHQVEWDSTSVANGEYELELRATAVDGRTATRPFSVLVNNEEPEATFAAPAPHLLWQSLADWQTVNGPAAWQVLADGAVEQVEFWVDGRLRWTQKEAPFAYGGPGGLLDASSLRPGAHGLLVRVVGTAGRVAESRATVLVPSA